MDEIYNLAYTLFYSSIPFLVIGFIGNVLVVRIVHKTREMHTPTNYLLVSMAASLVILLPFCCGRCVSLKFGNSFAS